VGGCSTPCYVGGVSTEVTQRQLRNDSGDIMRGLDQGQTYVVTRNGVPVGELTPLRRHRFVSAEAAVAAFANAPSVDLERLRADLDRVASQDVEPRA
jgi:antitoxin (DNA-binding transcriptional repressor) of toxin-antitoxin stability system